MIATSLRHRLGAAGWPPDAEVIWGRRFMVAPRRRAKAIPISYPLKREAAISASGTSRQSRHRSTSVVFGAKRKLTGPRLQTEHPEASDRKHRLPATFAKNRTRRGSSADPYRSAVMHISNIGFGSAAEITSPGSRLSWTTRCCRPA
jgi:hypothetical protein